MTLHCKCHVYDWILLFCLRDSLKMTAYMHLHFYIIMFSKYLCLAPLSQSLLIPPPGPEPAQWNSSRHIKPRLLFVSAEPTTAR